MKTRLATFGDFRCAHCHAQVASAHMFSGVNNRNHCPYCLWSCHLDLFVAGDRLSACKAPMKPIGLTMKPGRNKYRREARGELMLIHQCIECKILSINRIAADDDSQTVLSVFRESFTLDHQTQVVCQQNGIAVLNGSHAEIIQVQLYGHGAAIPAMDWR